MPIRKNRIVCQGISNHSSFSLLRNQSSFDLSAGGHMKASGHSKNKSFNLSQSFSKFDNPNIIMTQHHPFYQSGIGQKFNKNTALELQNQKEIRLIKKGFKPKHYKMQQTFNLSQNTAKVLDKIRTAYKYNANIRKIAKCWGFESKGYISNDQFHEIIKNNFDSSVTKQNCEEMLKSVGKNSENIDMLTFIKLAFQQEPFTKPKINVLDYQQTLQKTKSYQGLSSTLMQKISNLNEASIVHNERNKIQNNRSFVFPNVDVDRQQKTLSNSYLTFKNKQMQKTQPSLYQTMHSSSSPKFTFSTTKSHAVQFSPRNFEGINQQKTRFGATPAIKLNDQSLPENKREKIFDSKQRVLDELGSQQQLQKMKYMNKLEKIREHQLKQKQNILAIERKAEQRDNANMRRFREQNLAYNYVNFIHNDWK